jgi:hypothetical protein
MTFITHGFRVSVVSDVRERVRDFRITFALYAKKIFISWVCYTERVYKASNFFLFVSICAAMIVKKSSVHILYHKELANARIFYMFQTTKGYGRAVFCKNNTVYRS